MTDKRASALAHPHPIAYWAHVNYDGTEQHFQKPPDELPVLTITRVGNIEITRTWDRYRDNGMDAVEPPGTGWKILAREPGFSSWHRMAPDTAVENYEACRLQKVRCGCQEMTSRYKEIL